MILLPIICFCLFLLAIFDVLDAVDSGCSTAASYSDLNIVFQQTQGTADTTSYAHQLTLPPTSSGQTCSDIEGAMLLGGATTTCPTTCLTSIQAYVFTNDTNYVDIAMLRPADLALYPNYTKTGSVIYCASTSGNCGATIPYFAFYSATYADHYVSTSTSLPDSTYNFDNSGYPVCYGWKMPSTTADKETVASAYSTLSSTCNVPLYLGLISTTFSTTVATTTANAATTTVAAGATTTAAAGATTAAAGATTAANGATTAANGATTAAGSDPSATTNAAGGGGATTAGSGSGGGTTAANGATDGSGGAATTAADGSGGATTAAGGGSNTDPSGGSGTTAANGGAGGATTNAVPPVVVTDASGNPIIVSTEPSNKSGTRVWVWVVLGVGLFVLLLMILGMVYFLYSNFGKSVNSTRVRVNPYDRDLYTADGMSEPPPVPVSSLPAAGAT